MRKCEGGKEQNTEGTRKGLGNGNGCGFTAKHILKFKFFNLKKYSLLYASHILIRLWWIFV